MAGFELYAHRTARHRRTWTAAVVVLGVIFMIATAVLPFIPFILHNIQLMQANPHQAMAKPHIGITEMFLPTGLLIVCILAWVILFERRSPQTIGFNGQAFGRFLRGYMIGCAFLVVVVGGLWSLGVYSVEGPGVWAAPTMAAGLPIVGYVGLFIVQGSSEEVFMRGWLMQIIASRHGLIWGVIINSVIFGAMHLGNISPSPAMFAGVANVGLFGIFISLYACRERSIWGVCAFHGAWNWLLGVGFGLEVSGLDLKVAPLIVNLKDAPNTPWWLSGGVWGPEASVLTTAVLLAGIAFLVWRGALKPGDSFATPENPVPEVRFG